MRNNKDMHQRFSFHRYQVNKNGKDEVIWIPLFDNQRLGVYQWGHPALIEWFGEHFSSMEKFEHFQLNFERNNCYQLKQKKKQQEIIDHYLLLKEKDLQSKVATKEIKARI